MRQLWAIVRYINGHALNKRGGLKRFIQWQFKARILKVNNMEIDWINSTKLNIVKGRPASTANYYVGMNDFEEMGFLCHFLRAEDYFGDVGANVGIYTILAAGAIGANVVAIEPEASTLKELHKNIKLNSIKEKVSIVSAGVGEKEGDVYFSYGLDSINHVTTEEEATENIKISIKTLNNIFDVQKPIALKIDIEGYEMNALKGASQVLANNALKVILIELNSSGQRYGVEDIEIHNLLEQNGFHPYEYDPFTRTLKQTSFAEEKDNYIYLREIEFVRERLRKAPTFSIPSLNLTV